MSGQSVELRASTCIRVISSCVTIRIPLTDTLDRLHLVALGDYCGYSFLVTLGSCRHLDGLDQ